MAATVIELWPRRVQSADPATLVRATRGSMSREAFATVLSQVLGWPAKPGMIRAWESGIPVPRDVIEACQSAAMHDLSQAGPPPMPPGSPVIEEAYTANDGDALLIPCLALDGRVTWVSIPRRTFLSGGLGAATLAAVGAATGPRPPSTAAVRLHAPKVSAADLSPVERLEQLRRVLIDADNLHGSGCVIPAVLGQIHMISQLRGECRGSDRRELLVMQAKYAEFAGWLHQDSRDFNAARHWLDRSLEWSCAAEDRDLSTFVMARKSQLAGDMSAAADAIDLAEAAGRMARKRSRLKATAAVYGAHGYALADQKSECLRTIEQAQETATSLDDGSPWASWLDTSYIEVQRGRCLTILGDHATAATVFQQAIRGMPPTFRRDRGVYLARSAVAYADAREPEQATDAAMQALTIARDTQSGRVAAELAQVSAHLTPWAMLPAVVSFRDALASV
jgi:tetratricopeptide (TPR) repeat protein